MSITSISDIDFSVESTVDILLTPALAEEFAGVYSNARQPNQKSIGKLVTDIRANRYIHTGDPIKFTADGVMIDGINRCHAVLKTIETVKVTIRTGVHPDARDVTDVGTAFTLKDRLALNGVKRPGTVASALNGIEAFERGELTGLDDPFRASSTIPGSLAFLRDNPIVEAIALDADNLTKRLQKSGLLITTSQVATIIWALDTAGYRDKRSDFFKKLIKGFNNGADDPVLRLRARLSDPTEYKADQRGKKKDEVRVTSSLPTPHLVAMAIKAFNYYNDDSDMIFALRYRPTHEDFPTVK